MNRFGEVIGGFIFVLIVVWVFWIAGNPKRYTDKQTEGPGSCVLSPEPIRSFDIPGLHSFDNEVRRQTVYFATEREPLHLNNLDFGAYRNPRGEVTFGIAQIELPPRSVLTDVEVPSSLKVDIKREDREVFFRQLNKRAQRLGPLGDGFNDFTVYIHGFNNSYREEMWKAAKLTSDAHLGTVAVYDWPSVSGNLGYLKDRSALDYSARPLATFLSQLSSNLGAMHLNIVAHSMGGLAITRALSILADQGQLPQIENLLLAAPDVDTDYFDSELSSIATTGKIRYMTIYASESDKALQLSANLNHYAPLGLLPNHTRIKGARIVDVSRVARGLGHNYFVSSAKVEHDIETAVKRRGAYSATLPILGSGDVQYPRLTCPTE